MLVFDTSAFVNGWRDHYPRATFPSVWERVSEAMAARTVVAPREVYRELVGPNKQKDDEIAAWLRERGEAFLDPTEAVQRAVGPIYAEFPGPGRRDGADPFVIAEAQIRGLTVVTYEGRSHSGVPTKRWHRSMPGICQHIGVPCATLPEALGMLGATF